MAIFFNNKVTGNQNQGANGQNSAKEEFYKMRRGGETEWTTPRLCCNCNCLRNIIMNGPHRHNSNFLLCKKWGKFPTPDLSCTIY